MAFLVFVRVVHVARVDAIAVDHIAGADEKNLLKRGRRLESIDLVMFRVNVGLLFVFFRDPCGVAWRQGREAVVRGYGVSASPKTEVVVCAQYEK